MTSKQEQFVREYVIDRNASAAARRAGYSSRTAGEIGYEHLKKPEIQAAIREHTAAHFKELNISAEHVLSELAAVGFATVSENLRCSDKIRALELLGRYLSLFTDRVEHDFSSEPYAVNLRELLARAAQRQHEARRNLQ